MVKFLEELREEKAKLLRKSGGRRSLMNLSRQRKLEEKKLRAEIRALKHPNVVTTAKVAKNLGKRSGKILFKGAVILGKHLSALGEQQRTQERKSSMKKKSTKRKKKRR